MEEEGALFVVKRMVRKFKMVTEGRFTIMVFEMFVNTGIKFAAGLSNIYSWAVSAF